MDNFQHLFDSTGNWIAFRRDNYVFDTEGRWIGWLPWDDKTVVDRHGRYLGTIYPGDRFYRNVDEPYRGLPPAAGYPGYPGFPTTPGSTGYAERPEGTVDLRVKA